MTTRIVGIDLGTTKTCVAVVEGSSVRVIENGEGWRTTPAVVAYRADGDVLVGASAKRQAVTDPANTLHAIKRLIGRTFSEAQRDTPSLPYTVCSTDNGDAWLDIGGRKLAPPQVSAEVLRKAKLAAEDYLGEPVTAAVVTVPAHFNDAQRQATIDAGRIAGLEVRRLINEPTAAALAFAMEKHGKGDAKVAIYDLGGGTFDVSIIEMCSVNGERQIEVLSSNGDTFLGGDDFDQALVDHIVTDFRVDTGIDLRQDFIALQRLKEAAEKAKVELSDSAATEINLPFLTRDADGPRHLVFKLTRVEFERLVANLIERTIESCRSAVTDARIDITALEHVILVGGMTRMPKVRARVTEFFRRTPRRDINPDEAVAIGAAIEAGIIDGRVRDLVVFDVTPWSLGIETLGGVMTTMIRKNTMIPTAFGQVFSTADDNQSALTIKVYQGEHELARNNKVLGEFTLEGIGPARRGSPEIEVSFDIDINGILQVGAKDKKSGRKNEVTIKANSGLSERQVERIVREHLAQIAPSKDGNVPAESVQPVSTNEAAAVESPVTTVPPEVRTLKAFVSYAHADESFHDELDKHTSLLRRQGHLQSWHDRKLMPGDAWRDQIDQRLAEADIVLLLISADFLNSDFCYEEEMKVAMARHREGGARVVPIIVRSCAWRESPFARLQVIPKDGRPINQHADRDSVWAEVADALRQLVYELAKRPVVAK